MSHKKPTLEFFRKTAEAKGGNISEMAKALDCDRRTIHYWLEKNEKFKDVLDQVNESFVDLAETRLAANRTEGGNWVSFTYKLTELSVS